MHDVQVTPDGGDSGPLRTFVGLFFVPVVVVVLCVGVFIGFGWIAYDHQSVGDYLNDLKSGWRPRRAQAAYELSKILTADPDALADDPAARGELRALFGQADQGEMRRYLALVLGYTRDREATPLLIEAVNDDDSETRIYVLMALGALGDPEAESTLIEALRDPDPGVRKTAAHALGALGQPSSLGSLERLLEDAVADVRWNAALSTTRLGSQAGVPVLLEVLDRNLTEQVPDITPVQVEEAMVSAIAALGVSGAAQASPLLEELAAADPSLKVRQAALEALKVLSQDDDR
jgi:HEAT repeat protein